MSYFQRGSFDKKRPYNSGRSFNASRRRRPSFKAPQFTEDMLVKKAQIVEEQVEDSVAFGTLNLHPTILAQLERKNFINATPIQAQAIPVILEGKDVIGLAATGTGKTLAFLLPLLHFMVDDASKKALILAPTRELALQIEQELKLLLTREMRLFVTTCIGGTPIRRQISQLRMNNQFVIATPGRLKDLSERKALDLKDFDYVVLDEVDRMLDMGFIHEIRYLLSLLPEKRQSLFFSATTEGKTQEIMKQFLQNPVTVEVSKNHASHNVHQDIVKVKSDTKLTELVTILQKNDVTKTLVFCGTKMAVDNLWRDLKKHGFEVESMHGDKTQMHRQIALKKFKNGEVTVMIGTDVAARGIDVKDISHVINYDLPQSYEDYIHRIGRTGRGGSIGSAITFIPEGMNLTAKSQENRSSRNHFSRRPFTSQRQSSRRY